MTTENIALLFEWGDPSGQNYSKRDWGDYLQHGFSTVDVPRLIDLILNKELHNASADSNDIWVPLYAWRILGQLKSADAVKPLISQFNNLNDDDWALTEVPVVMGMIGEPAITPLFHYLCDFENAEYSRVIAASGLGEIVKEYPVHRDEIITLFREYLMSPDPASLDLNGLLICDLIEIKAIEVIDEIRSAFQNNYVNITIPGDLEDVEIALGLRDKRETPKPYYGLPGIPDLSSLLGTEDLDFSEPREHESYVRDTKKIGRNDPCLCGSGKKYKRCCLH